MLDPIKYRAVIMAARRLSKHMGKASGHPPVAGEYKDEAEMYADVGTLVDAVIDVHAFLWSTNPFKQEK